MNNTGKIVTAVAAGAAAGAILGVLFAPDKGSETRRKINDQGKKIVEGVKNKFQKGVERVNDLKNNIAKTVNDKVEELV